MSDLIDRQAAIDALHMHLMYRMGTDSNKKRLDDWINGLPSAQPETHEERTETHACDCISRQAVRFIETNSDSYPEEWNDDYEKGFTDALNKVIALPSVQPEIIRCKDCKHFEYDHLYVIHGVPVLGHELCNAWGDGCKTDENGYCFLAERRTDEPD